MKCPDCSGLGIDFVGCADFNGIAKCFECNGYADCLEMEPCPTCKKLKEKTETMIDNNNISEQFYGQN